MPDYDIDLMAQRLADEVDRKSCVQSAEAYETLIADIADAIRSFVGEQI